MKTNNTYKGKIHKGSLIENRPYHKGQHFKDKKTKRKTAKMRLDNEVYKLYEVPKGIFGKKKRQLMEIKEMHKMTERIAQFEKVSYEQFKKDFIKIFDGIDITYIDNYIKNAYSNIVMPTRKTVGSAGYDFATPVDIIIEPNKTFTVPTGIRCNMRNDFVLNIYVRSSIGFKYQTVLANGTGIIDSDYYNAENEGHIMIKLINHSDKTVTINAKDAFAQGVFLQFGITNDDMADGVRVGGIGSTGKQ